MPKYLILQRQFINVTFRYKSNTEQVFISVGEQLCCLSLCHSDTKGYTYNLWKNCYFCKGREMSRVQERSSLKYENATWDRLSYL